MFSFAKMHTDELYMQRCLELASCGNGFVNPNPMVGALLVYDDKIIGEGYHKSFGEAHAEVSAINNVPKQLEHLIPEATLYVNLEPCVHFGKTPPCADLIIQKKIKKVVIGCLDPNPLVSGKGMAKLINSGVEVQHGILKHKAEDLNKRFITFHTKKRPYVILKWAQSTDKFIAGKNFEQIHFTNEVCDVMVHKIRSENMAILVGARTVLTDDPKLTVRLWRGKNPIRIVFDGKNNLKQTSHIFNEEAKSIIFNFDKELRNENISYVKITQRDNYLTEIMHHLYELQINSLLIEGGTSTINRFITSGLWDETIVFRSDDLLGDGIKAPSIPGKIMSEERILNNTIISALHI